MPELPEVETVRQGLEPLIGGVIAEAKVFHPRTIRKSAGLVENLAGKRLINLQRRGKFLWFTLEDAEHDSTDDITLNPAEALIIHLGMSGQLLLDTSHQHKHLRASLRIMQNHDERMINFVDQRTFGFLHISPFNDEDLPIALEHIAPDIVDSKLDKAFIIQKLQTRHSAIKTLLLNQSLISGIGNIYADEALWCAGIHPASNAHAISITKLSQLLVCAQEIMQAAIAAGGTSFDSLYVAVNGQSGRYSQELKTYGRGGQVCYRCGGILQKIMLQQRSSCFCPHCQKLYTE